MQVDATSARPKSRVGESTQSSLRRHREVNETQQEQFDYLLYQVEDGFFRKVPGVVPDELYEAYLDRIAYEAKTLCDCNFVSYVLVVWDICQYAKSANIPFNARGSANASLVLYLIDVISIDPMVNGPGGKPLIFERFISPNRVGLPDIDLDFADDRRAEIKSYLNEKYGSDCVAEIATFQTLKGRQCFRDVCRAYSVPLFEVDKIAPLIISRDKGDENAHECIKDSCIEIPACAEFRTKYPEVIEKAIRLEGQIKAQGVHPSGMVVSDRPLACDLPVVAKRDGTKIAGLDMGDIEDRGLLKIDCLGLRTLRVLADTVTLVNRRHDIDICECAGCTQIRDMADLKRGRLLHRLEKDISDREKAVLQRELDRTKPRLDMWVEFIKYDDPHVISEIFSSGNTLGIFQFETPMFRKLTKRVNPRSILDLGDINAIGRPGPLRSGMVDQWDNRRKGTADVEFIHPIYDDVTAATMGIILYQEQLMFLAHDLGSMTWDRTEKLRKTVAKSVGREAMGQFEEEFVKGSIENGMTEQQARAIFSQIVEFGSYSFNASHSISYAFLGYRLAWLKKYVPQETLTSQVNSLKKRGKIRNLVQEARRMGLVVELPDINKSQIDYRLSPSGMIAGFSAVKGLGSVASTHLVELQPFKDWIDFAKRIQRRKVNRKHVSTLIAAGCFKSICPNTKVLLDNLLTLIDKPDSIMTQQILTEASCDEVNRFTKQEEVELAIKVLNLPTPVSPLSFYDDVYNAIDPIYTIIPIDSITTDTVSRNLILKGIIYEIDFGYKEGEEEEEEENVHRPKGGATFELDDGTDFIQAEVSSQVYERYKNFLVKENEEVPVIIRASKRAHSDRIEVADIAPLAEFSEHLKADQLTGFESALLNPPLKRYAQLIEKLRLSPLENVVETLPGARSDYQFRFLGTVTGLHEHRASNGTMAFLTVDDQTAAVELLVWSDAWSVFKKHVRLGEAVAVKARKLAPRNPKESYKLQISLRGAADDRILALSHLEEQDETNS